MSRKFTARPSLITAILWRELDEPPHDCVRPGLREYDDCAVCDAPMDEHGRVNTTDSGILTICPGDWLVLTTNGKETVTPIKADVLDWKYQAVENMPGVFVSKPVDIDAEQWIGFTGTNVPIDELHKTITPYADDPTDKSTCKHCGLPMNSVHGKMETVQGGASVCPGAWIIGLNEDDIYPCPNDVFSEKYTDGRTA